MPTVLYGLHFLPLMQKQLQKLDIVLRRMMRSIVERIRVAADHWRELMTRMKMRAEEAFKQYPVEVWTTRLPLPLAPSRCSCRGQLDALGDHRTACATSGVLSTRALPLEHAVARVCLEAARRHESRGPGR